MGFFSKLKECLRWFVRRRNNPVRVVPPHDTDFDNPGPQCRPVESFYNRIPIPGTGDYIGDGAKVLETPSGEVVTINERKGIQLGCGDIIYGFDTIKTDIWMQRGLGALCRDCEKERAKDVVANRILPEVARTLSFFCSQCRGYCEECRRTDICLRHSRKFIDLDGTISYLCPDCLRKAKIAKLLRELFPFLYTGHDRLPPPSQQPPRPVRIIRYIRKRTLCLFLVLFLTANSFVTKSGDSFLTQSATIAQQSRQAGRPAFKPEYNCPEDKTMEQDQIPFKIPVPSPAYQRLKTTQRDPLMTRLEEVLKKINVWENPEVQRQFKLACIGTDYGRQRALHKLADVIQAYYELTIHLQNPYMPFFTAEQIGNGGRGIHILDQAYNNFPLNRDENFLIRGLGIIGRPGFGKSSALFNIFSQTNVSFLHLDFKGSWRPYCAPLRASYIGWDCAAFDLQPPSGISWEHWLFVVSEAISLCTGLQYSQDVIVEAGHICRREKQDYENKSGIPTGICLRDLRQAVDLCSSNNPKRAQYIESTKTALSLLVGSEDQRIFSTRGGLPLSELLKGRFFLGCQYANTYQARFLLLYILLFQQYSHLGLDLPESSSLRHITSVDDASRAVSQVVSIFGSAGKLGPYLHTLKTLRAAGEGYIFVDQLVSPILEELKLLVNSWAVLGSVGGKNELDELASLMHLDEDQKNYLSRMGVRECVFYTPELVRAVNGLIPLVNRPQ
jgi:hypothetical protein